MIDPKVMDAVLSKSNWSMAAELTQKAFGAFEVFTPHFALPDPALVVPVDVQALYVPVSHSERYVKLPLELGGPAGEDKPVDPFSAPVVRPAGIHLHWALPDGLLRGELRDDPGAPMPMRALPNRWLVVRMTGPQKARRLDLAAWVIESERGKVWRLDEYPDGPAEGDGDELEPTELDGIIGGSPNWTAVYDATRNRFAFHDPLAGVDAGRVTTKLASYVVIGWWSLRTNDPLASSYWPFAVSRRLSEFGWTASTAPMGPKPAFQPQAVKLAATREAAGFSRQVDVRSALKLSASQAPLARAFNEVRFDMVGMPGFLTRYDTLMHGCVYGVPLTGGIGKDLAPKAAAIDLSMAPTLERLIAAQAAKGLGITARSKREYFESLLTSVANSSILTLGDRDGVVKLDEAEHADGFEAFRGPETYEDVIVERSQSALKAGRPLRTKRAAKESGAPIKAEVIWKGTRTGRSTASEYEMRQTASDLSRKMFGGPISNDAPVTRRVARPGPRYHRAVAPVVGLRNFGRTNRFSDGRFDDGALVCRWTMELVTGFGERYKAADYLPLLQASALPALTNTLLQHSYLYDPYMMTWAFAAIQQVVPAKYAAPMQSRLRGEMALRYSADGVYDGVAPVARGSGTTSAMTKMGISEELRRFSLFEGRDPSPVGITSWAQPWCPVWLEWEAVLEPGLALQGWLLDRVEFTGASETDGKTLTLRGRAAITSGLAKSYQAVIESYLIAENQRDAAGAGEIAESHEAALSDLAAFLREADLGSVTLDAVSDAWLAVQNGPDGRDMPVAPEVADALKALGLPRLVASGKLQLARARIIDSFGRFRDLAAGGITLPVALETTTRTGARAMSLPPRLSLPARIMWRFVDPADAGPAPAEGRLDQAEPANTVNPIAGFILPDFMDESIEVFDQTGTPLGEVLHDPVTGGLIWEGGVGREGPAVTLPEQGLPPSARLCGRIAQGMIDADIAQRANAETADKESPLSAFLRAVDTTMWSVDASLAFAGATIAGLVGRPVAVVSTLLWLDIPQELSLTGAFGANANAIRDMLIREAVFEAVKTQAFEVRLGELAKGYDGLYGYFIGEDFQHFHLVEKEVGRAARLNGSGQGFRALLGTIAAQIGTDLLPALSPIDCPYIIASEALPLHSGQRVRLTLLMHPSARVHATTGILPRKSLELVRDWVAPGLGRIAPSARIGPVIIDPDKVRLPKIAAFGANQTWTRRDGPLTWRDDPILSATQAALLPDGRVTLQEGYIRIAPADTEEGGG
ncbi:hypothetical protein GVY41_01300 [Frigidibacter albus]|nr:hypothetical protein [Frigidibacter albus]